MRCDAMRCDAMRCDAIRCDTMRYDAMRCDARRSGTLGCTISAAGAQWDWAIRLAKDLGGRTAGGTRPDDDHCRRAEVP